MRDNGQTVPWHERGASTTYDVAAAARHSSHIFDWFQVVSEFLLLDVAQGSVTRWQHAQRSDRSEHNGQTVPTGVQTTVGPLPGTTVRPFSASSQPGYNQPMLALSSKTLACVLLGASVRCQASGCTFAS